ncbi:MAG: NHLP bacteriocin system secretion protein [Alphaproteobacteria bacterium]|nr:NHLP bacteriocin system secretion protein [Alphaproteobacteria bacterium]
MTNTKHEKDTPPLFRDEALEYISTPNDVNKIISVVGNESWILVSVFIAITVLGLVWLFYGSIPITVPTQGILIPKSGIFRTITSPDGLNIIKEMAVKKGQSIKKDQVIAILENTELTKAIALRKNYIRDLKAKRSQLISEALHDLRIKQKHSNEKKTILQESLSRKAGYKEYLLELIWKEHLLLREGYTKEQNIINLEKELNILEEEETQTKDHLIKIEKDLLTDQENWRQKERDISLKLSDELRDLNNLKTRNEAASTIRSPIHGQVISLQYEMGDQVAPNTPIAVVSQGDNSQLEALIYLNSLEGKKVQVGMDVYMIPTHLQREQIGYIHGKVIEVSSYPETIRSLMARLQNEELAKKFTESNPPISARISINTQGMHSPLNHLNLTPGTLIYGRVVIERRSPFAILIPEIVTLVGAMP